MMYRIKRYGRLLAGMVIPLAVAVFSLSGESPAGSDTVETVPLPDSVDILHYTLNIRFSGTARGTISGIVDIQAYTLKDSVHTIPLMLEPPLVTDSVWIDEERVRFGYTGKNHLVVYLPAVADKESTILMTLFYHGHPPRDPQWGGFYFVNNTAFNMGVGMSVVPHPFGRAWFPCRDNFTDKATYDYFITVPDTLTAACPGTLREIIPNGRGTRTFHWNLSSPIPTYLSSVAVSHYAILRDTLQGEKGLIPALYFIPPGETARAVVTFSHVQQYLSLYEDLFGPYPWEKIGYAAVPFPHGAMEHATCIFVPESVVDSTTRHDDLLAHEFSHSWFGNLVTCKTSGDMWLNEGWASYCEALYHEFSKGKDDYDRYIATNHMRVLRFAHIADQGYHALANIPENLTYGMTVYKKGEDIVHALRNFLGDKVFFDALKQYFRTYAFGNISTEAFEHFLTKVTHRNLQDFFNAWVYTPGFPHFSLDSVMVIRDRDDYITGVFIRQRLVGREDPVINIPLQVTLLDDAWQEHTYEVVISGLRQHKTLITSFRPLTVMINLDQNIPDATTCGHRIIRHPGTYSFDHCFFRLNVSATGDSAYFRIIHHWTGPEYTSGIPEGLEVSSSRYWSIEGVFPDDITWDGHFFFDFSPSEHLDTLTAPAATDALFLLYRPRLTAPWQILPTTAEGSATAGYLRTQLLKKGDYCLAIQKGKTPPRPISTD